MFGIDELFENLINEARSTEDIMKLLFNRYVTHGMVPDDVFYDVFDADPTKKKSYTRWVLDKYDNEPRLIRKIAGDGSIGDMFSYFQERNNDQHFTKLTDLTSVQKAMEMLPTWDNVLAKIGNGPKNDFDIVYDTPEWKIAVPHTYEAAEKLGKGCKWCTSGAFRDGDWYFDKYTSDGPLWINLDYRDGGEESPIDGKEYPFKRYQFCFETENGRGAMMDINDDPVNLEEIDMPQEVIDFYGEQNEEYVKVIEGFGMDTQSEAEAAYEAWRSENVVNLVNDVDYGLYLAPEYDYNYRIPEDGRPTYFMLYESGDPNDPICNEELPTSNYMVENLYDDHVASAFVLKNTIDKEFVVYYDNHTWFADDSKWKLDMEHGVFYFWRPGMLTAVRTDGGNRFKDFNNNGPRSYDITNVEVSPVTDAVRNGNIYFEVSFLDSGKMLVAYNSMYDKLVRVTSLDMPANGDHFIPEESDGKIVVRGVLGTYNITDDKSDIGENTNISVEKKLNDHIYLVRDDFCDDYNLYNSKTKKLIFDNWFGVAKFCDDIPCIITIGNRIGRDRFCVAYNYKNDTFSSKYRLMNRLGNFLLGRTLSDFTIMNSDFNELFKGEILKNIISFKGNDAIIYEDNTGIHILTIPQFERLLPNGARSLSNTVLRDVLSFKYENHDYLVDLVTGIGCVCPKNSGYHILKQIGDRNAQSFIVHCDAGDNVYYNGALILDKFVDDVFVNDGSDNPGFFGYEDNGSIFFHRMSDGATLPSKQGIRNAQIRTHSYNYDGCVTLLMNAAPGSDSRIEVEYDPMTNSVKDIAAPEGYDKDYITACIFGNGHSTLNENYKSWMDRLSKVVF